MNETRRLTTHDLSSSGSWRRSDTTPANVPGLAWWRWTAMTRGPRGTSGVSPVADRTDCVKGQLWPRRLPTTR